MDGALGQDMDLFSLRSVMCVLGEASKCIPAEEEWQLSAPWSALSLRNQTEVADHQ